MQPGQTALRLTCFAILSAVEEDLRSAIAGEVARSGTPLSLPKDVRKKASSRLATARKNRPETISDRDADLLRFTDFSDLAEILKAMAGDFWNVERGQIMQIVAHMERLAPARNRVCHSRPLEPDDAAAFIDLTHYLKASSAELSWPHLQAALAQIKDNPSEVLKISIPDFWMIDVKAKKNNLPPTEFDDTGFVGRDDDRARLNHLLLSNHPVITVVGEGGLGKTALALRCMYDLLERGDEVPYEAIVWVSLKTKTLTPAGAREIHDAIRSAAGASEIIGKQLGIASPENNMDVLLERIVECLRTTKTLLAIDNFETLGGQAQLRPLLASVGVGSKVLITSRVGLGELELRFPLAALDETTASSLMRRIARVHGLISIEQAAAEVLSKYCRRLFFNPLLIKWFVRSVQMGADPGRLLDRKGDAFSEVLRFCFENLFERLDGVERQILFVLASAQRPLSQAELCYLTGDLEQDSVDWSLNKLFNSSTLRTTLEPNGPGGIATSRYALTDIASYFISSIAPPPPEVFARVQKALRDLADLDASQAAKTAAYKYDIKSVRSKNGDERIGAAFLRRALDAADSEKGDLAEARRCLEQARRLLPMYAEVYRISGVVEGPHDPYRADGYYKEAIEFDPASLIIRYTYANFLNRYLDNAPASLEQLDTIEASDPGDTNVMGLRSVVLAKLGRFSDAAEINERLLLLTERPRRWRIQTFNQAAHCLQRWAGQSIRMRELEMAAKQLSRSRAILTEAFKASDWDEQTATTASHVVNDSMNLYAKFPVEADTTSIVDLLCKVAAERACDLSKSALRDFRGSIRDDGLRALVDQLNMDGAVLVRQRYVGVIKSLRLGFGFISTSSGGELYFSQKKISRREVWAELQRGDEVEYEIGSNNKGDIAVGVIRVARSSNS